MSDPSDVVVIEGDLAGAVKVKDAVVKLVGSEVCDFAQTDLIVDLTRMLLS